MLSAGTLRLHALGAVWEGARTCRGARQQFQNVVVAQLLGQAERCLAMLRVARRQSLPADFAHLVTCVDVRAGLHELGDRADVAEASSTHESGLARLRHGARRFMRLPTRPQLKLKPAAGDSRCPLR